jgi:hypothetical protein
VQQARFQDFCRRVCINRKIIFYEMNLNLRFAEYLKDLMSIDRHRFVSLDLHKNLLGDHGVKILMTEIRRSKSLVDLNLASNEISNDGMISIFDALQDN